MRWHKGVWLGCLWNLRNLGDLRLRNLSHIWWDLLLRNLRWIKELTLRHESRRKVLIRTNIRWHVRKTRLLKHWLWSWYKSLHRNSWHHWYLRHIRLLNIWLKLLCLWSLLIVDNSILFFCPQLRLSMSISTQISLLTKSFSILDTQWSLVKIVRMF